MATGAEIIVVYEVMDPGHRCKSVFFEDQREAVAYMKAVLAQYGPPLRKGSAPIIEHSVASVSDLVNLLNGYYECMTEEQLEAAVAAQ